MLPLALLGFVLLGLTLASGSKAAPGALPPGLPPPPAPPEPTISPATAAQVATSISASSPVTLPPDVVNQIAQVIASKDVAKMGALASALAAKYPFAAQQLRNAAANIAKIVMTGSGTVTPPAVTPSAPAPKPAVPTVTTMPVPNAGPTAQQDADIRAQIYRATDPVALDNLASVLGGKPGYGALAALASARAAELRAMVATGQGVQAVQAVLNQAAPAVTAATLPLLYKGMPAGNEAAVKRWQKIVGVSQDGVFGSGTETATKKWQAAHGVYVDGKVGPKTWAAAASIEANALPTPAAPTVTVAPPSISVPTTATPLVPLTDLQLKTQATAQYIKGAKRGSEDKIMIKNWQTAAGVPGPDGMFGAGSAERMAELGVSDLPMVWYWPKTNATARVTTYKSRLNELAKQADAAGDANRASLLRASAARDNGQGKQIGE